MPRSTDRATRRRTVLARARAVKPAFALAPETAPVILEVCRLGHGLAREYELRRALTPDVATVAERGGEVVG